MRLLFRPIVGSTAAILMATIPTVSLANSAPAAAPPARAESQTERSEALAGNPLLIVVGAVVAILVLVLIFAGDDEDEPVSP